MHVRTRLASRVAVIALTMGAVAIPLAAAAGAPASPTLTPTPASELTNGQTISVSGSGFPTTAAGQTAYIVECSGIPTAATCDNSTLVQAQTTPAGVLPATAFTVKAGAIGNGFCPSMTAAGGCYLAATTNPGDPTDTASGTAAPISFAPVLAVSPNTGIKDGNTLNVLGYGFQKAVHSVYVVECAGTVPTTTSCDGGTLVTPQPQTTTDGTFTASITVHGGTVGDGTCNAGQTCTITATTDISPTPAPDTSAIAHITFANVIQKVHTLMFAAAKLSHGKVTVSGTISAAQKGVKGLSVTVYERAKGTKKWKKAGSTTSRKGGAFAVKGLKHFKHAEQYRAKHPKQSVGKTVYLASHSGTSTIK